MKKLHGEAARAIGERFLAELRECMEPGTQVRLSDLPPEASQEFSWRAAQGALAGRKLAKELRFAKPGSEAWERAMNTPLG